MKTLIAFYKGSAGEYQALGDHAPTLMRQAASMRNNYREIWKNF